VGTDFLTLALGQTEKLLVKTLSGEMLSTPECRSIVSMPSRCYAIDGEGVLRLADEAL
jgi:hypothetical protein